MSSIKDSALNCLLYIILLLTFLTWPFEIIKGQAIDRGGLHSLTLSHGLSDLLVNEIYKDKQGYVWFGTESSVDRFDGNQIVRFSIPGDKHKSRRVLCFAEIPDKILYIGTNQGLFFIKKNDRQLYPVFPDKLNCNINSLCLGPDNKLYIGTGAGLYIYDLKRGSLEHKLLVDDNLSEGNDIKGLWCQGSTTLWLLSPHRLWQMNLDKTQTIAYKLPVNVVSTRLCEIGNIIYVGTDGGGIIPFDIKTLEFKKIIRVGNDIVTSLSATADNELLIGTDGEGIYLYSVDERVVTDHFTSSPDSKMQLRSNSVYSVMKDDMGLLWVGYYQSGIDYTPKPSYAPELISIPEELEITQDLIRALEKWNGYTAIGTHAGIVLINDSTGNAKKYSTPEISSNLIMSLKAKDGFIFAGTYHGGLYKLDPKNGIITRFGPKELYDQSIFKLETDPQGELWAATSDGLYRFKDHSDLNFETYTSKNSQLPQGNVYEIFFDSLGRGWICTENGMAIWNGEYIQTSGFPPGFIDKMKIRVVFEDKDHRLYFAPDRGVIWVSDLSLQNFFPLEESDDERFLQVTGLIEDKDGWIWLATDKCLISFNKKSPVDFMIFNHVGGVTNPGYTLAAPHEDINGDLWFGSTTGLHKVDFQEVRNERENRSFSPLIISEVESSGRPVSNLEKISDNAYSILLNKDQRDLTIHVTDLNYEYRDYFEVEYKIYKKGVENEWKWANGADPIKFNELPEGKCTIIMKIAGAPESQISLQVRRYKTFPWIWIVAGILLLLIITFIFIRHKRNRNEERNENENLNITGDIEGANIVEKQIAYRTTRLSDEECKRILKNLDKLMKEQKPFTNPDLKSKDLAEMVNTTAHSLSFVFNQYLDKSYYDYVNEFRVEEFKRLVRDGDVSKYTLTTMAEKCGFSSRASFFRHFKSLTGMTPAEYLKKADSEN